ncbi:small subunit processome component 20 homolog [Armigeres subalbatus]|uniref:small subunit processome component 20 homolog n=1 Tax=Armigeres subalbatus TaxID=124917 RepID=UPI002ED27AE3
MKNRPVKHKTKNAFQFKTFHDRIAEVDVRRSALYYVEHEYEELDENQSFFQQTIQKWSALNLSDEYQKFQAPLRGIVTLPQLLHKREFVVGHLLSSLDNATELSLQALLEFVVVLARDLREDFCPYFEPIFDKLLNFLDTKDPHLLEWTLLCLAFLFKIMRSYLRKRLDLIFERIVMMLDDAKPLHINNFAAECFSFLARDIKNKQEMVFMVTNAVKNNPSATTGCGRLLFEVMRGVNQQLHSCADDFWKLLFNLLNSVDSGFESEVLFNILVQTVSDMLQCVASTNLAPFWVAIFKAVENCLPDDVEMVNEPSLHYIIQLIGVAVEHQHGKYVNNTTELIRLLVKTVNRSDSERILTNVTKIATIMMLSRNLNITQLDASRLSKNIMAIGPRSRGVFEEFVLGVVDYSMFEILIMPDYMKFFEKNCDTQSIRLLTRIVMKKSPLCKSGINLHQWKQFPVRFKIENTKQQIMALLKGGLNKNHRTDFLLSAALLPHLLDFYNDVEIHQCIEQETSTILSELNSHSSKQQIIALRILVETLVHCNYGNIQMFITITEKLLPIVAKTKQSSLLNVISLCLVKIHLDKPKLLTDKLFLIAHAQLSDFLVSEHHRTRLLVVHMFSLFNNLPRLSIKNEEQTLFEVLYAIETVEPNIHTYREQVMQLKKLEFESNLFQGMSDESFRLDAMRFVLSMLSVNFKLLWVPASEVLQSYAEEFVVSDFWKIYKQQLDYTLECINCPETLHDENGDDDCFGLVSEENDEKIDMINYRVQLLVTLSKLNRVFESKNRDIVEAFLNFIQTEYRVRQHTDAEASESIPKATQKILIAYLNIFAKVKNPKTIFKSEKLYELFEELLAHRSFEVQKLALDCIFTYNNAAVTPYKENLYRLTSDKTIKEEMQNFFKEDTENDGVLQCVILDAHRSEVVPLIMKIVHTKMALKVTPTELKALLMRFVGNFRENEINLFISMSFSYFENLLRSDPFETYQAITECNTRFEDDLPIYRIQVLIKMIENIREQFGGLKDESFMQYLVHIKLCMDSILMQMEHSTVKQLKSQALINLVEFFDHFDNYPWTSKEIDTVFAIYVQPQLVKLETECIHSPTPLLKLFITWSKNPRYYQLLVRSLSSEGFDIKFTPLAYIVSLLNGEKTSDAVCQEIMKMVTSMLILDTSETEIMEVHNSLLVNRNQLIENGVNLGSHLLMPFVMNIISYIQKIMMRKRSINKDHLLVLSRIADHVKNEESCDAITDMLLPMVVRKVTLPNVDVESIQQMHAAMYSLMKRIPHPEKHLRRIGILLERVLDLATRKILSQMIRLISEKSPEHTTCASILENMNAMDRRWLEQPDYERRLGAFRTIDRMMENGETLGIDLTLLFVHQCFYYLKTDSDLAVRDNTNHFLRKVTVHSIKTFGTDRKEETLYLIERVILSALMKGIKDKNETTRNENIQLLGDLSRECAEYCSVFADLHPFTNTDDREIDFFDNITHLQIHRHRRAMNRFCKTAQTLSKLPSKQTLTNFVLPIVSSYLCNEAYRKKVRLTDAAGSCVALIGRMLPWSSYKTLLKQYLNKMKHNLEYQKQLLRLVVALLDNFHYDLSQADTGFLQDIGGLVQLASVKSSETDNLENVTNADQELQKESSDELHLNDEDNDCDQDEESTKISVCQISFASMTILTKENAETVMYEISKVLIPDLFSTINYKEIPDSIKLNERKERYQREKEEMSKIPVAIAIVKLLQKLPSKFMDLNLPKLLMKVINFLKSNLKQVRSIARETLRNMLLSVGPPLLRTILENLSAMLSRGFQRHVMVVTVHTLLDTVKEQLNAEIVDDILQLVLNICINDIFGRLSEEKEVGSVISKTPEAKPNKKSFLTLHILAKKMSEKSTLDLIMPFKEIIAKTNSRKTVIKVEEALGKIADGICLNENISVESVLIFVFGITSESIPNLVCGAKQTNLTDKQKTKIKEKRSDIYLIPAEPKRRGAFNQISLVTSARTNAHVFVEMGLEILHTLIKRNQVLSLDYEAFLDPLVPILVDSLNSNHIKVTTLSIKCIASIWSSKLELSSIKGNIATIVDNLLKLLHKYATAVVGRRDDNFQLVKNSFKAVVTLLKFVKYFEVNIDQLNMLLLYVEQDLYHNEKQNMALILLRSIIGRKLRATEMPTIIKKVAELSITHDTPKIREDCRQIVLEYLLTYTLGKTIDVTVNFYIGQLEYEVISGRESAVQMLEAIFKSFPTNMLNNKAAFFFITVGIRLVNEESSNCRALVAQSLETLLSRIDQSCYKELLELIQTMLQGAKMSHRELAAQLIIRMVNVEKESFSARLEQVIPPLLFTITDTNDECSGKFVKLKSSAVPREDSVEMQKAKDHSLVQTLNAFTRIFEECPQILTGQRYPEFIDELSYSLQSLMSHGHQWIRFAALKLVGLILSAIDFDIVHKALQGEELRTNQRYIYGNPRSDVRSLVLDMCSQLVPAETEDDVASLVAQNLLLVANILKVIPLQTNVEKLENHNASKDINVAWLIRRVRYVLQSEVAKAPKSIVLRKHMFQWMEALIGILDKNMAESIAPAILSPVTRELSDKDHLNSTLKTIVMRLGNRVKSKIGGEKYDEIRLHMQSKILEKRGARQRAIAVEKINNPLQAVKRKAAIKNRKKVAKKQKLETMRSIGKTAYRSSASTKSKRRRMEDLFQ